jgi:hypothetical protein
MANLQTSNVTGNITVTGIEFINGPIRFLRGDGDYSTIVRASNYPSQGYTSSTQNYWVELASSGGTHIVLNADGAGNAPENTFDHFTIWQSSSNTSAGGERKLWVTNTGNLNTVADINATGNYRQGGSAMISIVQIGPSATNIAFSSTINAQYTLNPTTIPAAARYVLCDIFVTANFSDHQNFMFSRGNMGQQKNWVDTRGNNPANEFGNLTSQENTIVTYPGEQDGYTPNYGIWFASQILPVVGRTVWINNYGNSGSNGYVYIIVKGYSL